MQPSLRLENSSPRSRASVTAAAANEWYRLSVVWCVAIGVVGYIWAMKLYERGPARSAA